jgi:hypothetical protein
MNPGSLAMGQGSKLDNTSTATSRSGDIWSTVNFYPEPMYYKSSVKTEQFVILGLIAVAVIYIWRA